MNARVPLLFLLCAAPLPAAYGPPVLETNSEFFAYGDFGGNSRRSYVVIDRTSGGMRAANTNSVGGLTMPAAVPTGVTGVAGVAVGRFTLTTHDAVAVTSPETNRVKIAGPYGALFDAWPSGVGPRDIVGLPLPGGTTGKDDLAAVTVLNHPTSPYRRNLMLNASLAFTSWGVQTPTNQPFHPLATVLIDGETATYAELRANGTSLAFTIRDSQSSTLPVLTECTGVLVGSTVCFGNFNPKTTRSVFVFHVPDSASIQVSALDATRLLGSPVTHALGTRLAWVHPVQAGTEVRLTGCDQDGSNLRVFEFNGSNVPSLVQTLPAPKGLRWTGLVPAADGGWFAASAAPGETVSTRFQRFTHQGGTNPFVAGETYDLTPLRPEELGGDVMLFAGQPFHDNNPVLRGRLRTGGWTSNITVGPAPGGNIQGTRETWRGATLGLGSPGTSNLGSTPEGVTHGLANQVAADASCYSLDPPVGLLPDAIIFDPPGGPQTSTIHIALAANNPATTVLYSISSPGRWAAYSSPLGPFSTDTTIYAYATDGTLKTPVIAATYTFPAYPGDLDSDNDGVPDFVEQQYGIDPVESTLDADLDGVPDLQEILAGSDPADVDSVPAPGALSPYDRYFEISVEPRSHSGVEERATLTLLPSLEPDPPKWEGTRVTVCRPDGTLELEAMAGTQPGGVMLLDSHRTVPQPPLFWVAGTPDRFMIDAGGATYYLHGRGLFRLLDYSAPALYPLPKPTLTGTGAQQAAQWVAAIRTHFTTNARVAAGGIASYLETVDLLLAERALGTIFWKRGLIPNEKITLTPFRGDTLPDRHSLREEWLAELPLATDSDTGYDWAQLLAFIRAGAAGTQTREGLDLLAREIYRIGFHAYDDPDKPLAMPPFEALRAFMDTGTLPADYADLLTTTSGVLTRATDYRNSFIEFLPAREHTPSQLTLVAATGFDMDPWLRLTLASTGTRYLLAEPDGTPFRRPKGFRILQGWRFLVSGHLTAPLSEDQILLVDSISLLDAPMPGQTDGDGNLLVDSWEAFLYGTLGNNPFADDDRDGYMALQEMFEWTDPDYGDSYPAAPVIDLRPPPIAIAATGPRAFVLSWRWPTYYQSRITFFIQGGPDLRDYQLINSSVPGDAGGNYQTPVDATTHPPTYFYRAGMKLR
ncbi:MAG: hypothetical protein K9N23_19505 [Akkermansiaceae bacterium]|nr:hypothetical protein [Akkermansiaceae bacterium]MCF7733883.1 hypothetical protein [Akkermansiaceae bacterium]